MTWHHHHDGDDRILFCRADGTECIEEYDGLVCDGLIRDEATLTWGPCKWHLAYGEYVVDVGEQLTLVTDLEVAGSDRADPLPSQIRHLRLGPGLG